MKAIVLAAGMGIRLGDLARDRPKAMLEFRGRTLLDHQRAVFAACGIEPVVVVGGYRNDRLPTDGLVRYQNPRFAETNMVETLMCARGELDGPVVISYGDVLFEARVLQQVVEAEVSIGVAVDLDWRPYWEARFGNLHTDVETLEMTPDGRISRIGQADPRPDQLHARYIGLLKFDGPGAEQVKAVYDHAREARYGRPWQTSKSFECGYMTDLLQELIDRGVRVDAIPVRRGWLEFDTPEDVALATTWARSGRLDEFCNLGGSGDSRS